MHRPEVVPDKTQEEKNELSVPSDAKPILIQTGLASWYGPPYHNRKSSNGEVYDINAV